MTIWTEEGKDGAPVSVRSNETKTIESLDRRGEREVLPKVGLYQRGLLKSVISWAIPSIIA
jgi:hypothetical protein